MARVGARSALDPHPARHRTTPRRGCAGGVGPRRSPRRALGDHPRRASSWGRGTGARRGVLGDGRRARASGGPGRRRPTRGIRPSPRPTTRARPRRGRRRSPRRLPAAPPICPGASGVGAGVRGHGWNASRRRRGRAAPSGYEAPLRHRRRSGCVSLWLQALLQGPRRARPRSAHARGGRRLEIPSPSGRGGAGRLRPAGDQGGGRKQGRVPPRPSPLALRGPLGRGAETQDRWRPTAGGQKGLVDALSPFPR